MKYRSLFIGVAISLFMPIFAFSSQSESLYPLFDGKLVKVFVAHMEDLTKGHDMDTAQLKKSLEEALKARKSIRFQMVDSKEAAEIVIEGNIQGFLWTDHDPVDMIMGVGGAAMDAAIIEDFASLEADVSVTNQKSQKVLWNKHVRATVTKKPMSKSESLPLIAEDFAKVFIKQCFAKRRKR